MNKRAWGRCCEMAALITILLAQYTTILVLLGRTRLANGKNNQPLMLGRTTRRICATAKHEMAMCIVRYSTSRIRCRRRMGRIVG